MTGKNNEQQLWRSLPFTVGPAAEQLATVEALLAGLAHTRQPALRWYGASSRALVLGAGQKLTEIDLAACHSAAIPLHRRSSGGAAVLFEPDFLMLDIALPNDHWLRLDDVTESYGWLGSVWVATLQQLGLPARTMSVAEARSDTQALDPLAKRVCFGGRSPYEVLVEEAKVIGFAQIRRRNGVVFQVGLYTSWVPEHLVNLLALSQAERTSLSDQLRQRVAGLSDLLPTPPAPITVMGAFATALGASYGIELTPSEWLLSEREAQHQAMARYAPL